MPILTCFKHIRWPLAWPWARRKASSISDLASSDSDEYVPTPEDYPVFPPPTPRRILENRDAYLAKLSTIKFSAPQGEFDDKPLYSLYRLYEFVLLDKVISYRNQLEYFWRQKSWPVHDIPDPKDEDPERYAFLACCTLLLVRSFNERIKLGLDRNMPSLITPEEAERGRNRPDHLRAYERAPEWAERAASLVATLFVPTEGGEILDKGDGRACPEFLAKNIVLWTPHISFT
ncbi:hypothetical protein SPBR_05297 [Sporothrix brasiliensis 5110]|uniref:Uncharacterized protein n=1 Tax=Sporothrix brasiliensis 5110 TaxID=1398154 RepID=A0A0C2IDS4_9PEZI|nr:uncharacterized protein SPBR_05297 [Sporothrix brasiliensis 5110]KIH87416.1 hypothetical protein SPBR_05297 [Sporothrix brasiliensis 5110]